MGLRFRCLRKRNKFQQSEKLHNCQLEAASSETKNNLKNLNQLSEQIVQAFILPNTAWIEYLLLSLA
jgi:hypothetical protein